MNSKPSPLISFTVSFAIAQVLWWIPIAEVRSTAGQVPHHANKKKTDGWRVKLEASWVYYLDADKTAECYQTVATLLHPLLWSLPSAVFSGILSMRLQQALLVTSTCLVYILHTVAELNANIWARVAVIWICMHTSSMPELFEAQTTPPKLLLIFLPHVSLYSNTMYSM